MRPTSSNTNIFLFALTAVVALWYQANFIEASSSDSDTLSTPEGTCNSKLLNSAFVFVKPHANTAATQELVKSKLIGAGIEILSEVDIDGRTIDDRKLIDQHYYAIASKATILPAKDIPVPEGKFKEEFGESWKAVVEEDRACNAMEACQRLQCTPSELNDAWDKSPKVVKFGGGFYCGLVPVKDKPSLYVFNAFFMSMRNKFVGEGASIHCYEVQWDPSTLSWRSFRNELLGPTNPKDGPSGSIRQTILERYEQLGLASEPNKSDNGVHASASPFEGLAEKTNWMQRQFGDDAFGKALLESGIPEVVMEQWSVDPQVLLPGGKKGSVFDELEDLDVEDCLAKMKELHKLNQ